jgi:hypothetical protein
MTSFLPKFSVYDTPLTLEDISTDAFRETRLAVLSEIIAIKRLRRIQLGPKLSITFEHKLLVWFQIQEMLWAEGRTAHIEEELLAYNPLVPRPNITPVTVMWEYTDAQERRESLSKLWNFVSYLYLQVGEQKYFAQPLPEDALQIPEARAPSVNFLCFHVDSRFATGERTLHIHHPHYTAEATVPFEAWSCIH